MERSLINCNDVALVCGDGKDAYPTVTPFRPASDWPELARNVPCGAEINNVYPLLRTLFHTMACDAANFGTADWNPLGQWIQPGQRVVIKPNLVRHRHMAGGDYRAVVTHGSVVRAIADYAALALRGDGQIVVGDAPVQGSDFASMAVKTGLREVCDDITHCWGIPVRLADFRLWAFQERGHQKFEVGSPLAGDIDGYRAVRLDRESMLVPLDEHADRYRVTCYNPANMQNHHNPDRHEYLIAKAVLDADVVINVPKLKTHRKVGMTAAMKNLVGINGHKDWLPHHRCGSPQEGGDEYLWLSRLKRIRTFFEEGIFSHPGSKANFLRRFSCRALNRISDHFVRDPFYEGSWYGNDTCWRMVLDLNRILFYADREGRMTDTVRRRGLTIVDTIVAGEGEGPMEPDPRHCNCLAAGQNPVAVDAVLATIIGFDYRKLPLISNSFSPRRWPLVNFLPSDIHVSSNDTRFSGLKVGESCSGFNFKPPSGWVGHVELASGMQTETIKK